jgi:uncharacterized protein (TIGR03067 family)
MENNLVQEEVKKFQGTWKQVAYERDGVKEPFDEEKEWEPCTTFTGNRFVVTIADGSTPIKGTFKVDPTHNPKAIDYTDTFGVDAGKTFLAIYKFENDRLIFCAAAAGHERPTGFRTKTGQVLRTNEREIISGHKT